MKKAVYVPDRGDIIWTDFDPQAGREQAGRRPALVLSRRFRRRASWHQDGQAGEDLAEVAFISREQAVAPFCEGSDEDVGDGALVNVAEAAGQGGGDCLSRAL